MSIKLTWKDNTTKETRYEIYKLAPDGTRQLVDSILSGGVTNTKGEFHEWIGAGSYECGDHTYDVAAVSDTEQRAFLPEPVTITLPCDENVVICHRFETNAGNSAPAAAQVSNVYNLSSYVASVPNIKDTLQTSARFSGASAVEYKSGGPNASKLSFFPNNSTGETNRDFTVEGWFKFDQFNTEYNENGGVLFTGSKPTEITPHPSIEGGVYHTPSEAVDGNVAKVFFRCYAGTNIGQLREYVTALPVIKIDQWTHIAWVKRESQLHIYVDGHVHESFTFAGLNVASKGTTNGMRIGSGTAAYVQANPGMGFQGNMVDFRVINKQAITICPDIFPEPLCELGQPVDENRNVENEYVELDACTGVNLPARMWMDGSNQNAVTLTSTTSIDLDTSSCPCAARVILPILGPDTSTFKDIHSFSFASWFRSDDLIQHGSGPRDLLDYTYSVGKAKYGFKITLSSVEGGSQGTLDVVCGTGLTGEWNVYSKSPNRWKPDLWHHVIVIHHGQWISIYIDGEFYRMTPTINPITSHNERPRIGTGSWSQGLSLSTWQFYKNKALNDDEINELYDPVDNDCLPPKYPPSAVECDDLLFHLSESGRLNASEFTTDHPLIDSSKYNRKFYNLLESPLITQPVSFDIQSELSDSSVSPMLSSYYIMNDSVEVDDKFLFTDQDDVCLDMWMNTSDKTTTIAHTVDDSSTSMGVNDWYVSQSDHKLTFAHNNTAVQVTLPEDQWIHLVCVLRSGEKELFINGDRAIMTSVNIVDVIPTNGLLKLRGTFDDLRIIKNNYVYVGPFDVPTNYTDTSCRDETPDTTCVHITNSDVFDTWTSHNSTGNLSTSVVTHSSKQLVTLQTISGPVNHTGLVRPDVIVFDFDLNTIKQIQLNLNVQVLRLDDSDGSDLYLVLKQNSTWFYYGIGHTGDSLQSISKNYVIDMINAPGLETSIAFGGDTIDLSGDTPTQFGIGISNTASGTVQVQLSDFDLKLIGSRCDSIITPVNPDCRSVTIHLQSNNQPDAHPVIIDRSSYSNSLTYDNVTHSTDDSKFGSSSLLFDGSPNSHIRVSNTGVLNHKMSPFMK